MTVYRYGKHPLHTSADTDRMILVSLERYLKSRGEALPPCTVRRTAHGKPFLPNGYPHIGVTHTDDEVFVALNDVPFGIDCEKRGRTARHTDSIVRRFFTDGERKLFEEAAPDKRDEVFLVLWVKKEALVKAFGRGIGAMPNTDTQSASGHFSDRSDEADILFVYYPTAAELEALCEPSETENRP